MLAELTQSLALQGVESGIVAAKGRRVGETHISPKGVDVNLSRTGFISRIWTGHSAMMLRTLRQIATNYDLLHVHELWHYPGYSAYRVASDLGKPFLVTIHGALEPWALNHKGAKKRIYMKFMQRRILNKASVLHALTVEEVKQIRSQKIATPIVKIPNGINPKTFQELPQSTEFLKCYPQLAGKKLILFLGRIHPKKGLDVLTEAFGSISIVRDDVALIIAGPDEIGYQSELVTKLKRHGVAQKVLFTGPLNGRMKLAALSVADIFVLSSYSEGFSVAVLEAMACGLPLVLSRQCYFPEVAEQGAGLVIEPDVDQLRNALLWLLDRPDRRQDMGMAGRKVVMGHYTWTHVATQMEKVYCDMVSSGGR